MGLISVEAKPTKEEKRMVEVAETQGERDAPSGIALLIKTQISRALINFNLDVIFRTISEENSETRNSTYWIRRWATSGRDDIEIAGRRIAKT